MNILEKLLKALFGTERKPAPVPVPVRVKNK